MARIKNITICLRCNTLKQIVIVFILTLITINRAFSQQHSEIADTVSNSKSNKISSTSSNTSRWNSLMNWNFMALPFASYSPETNWQFGLTGVYFFKTKLYKYMKKDITISRSFMHKYLNLIIILFIA